jgi:hypothetical protein
MGRLQTSKFDEPLGALLYPLRWAQTIRADRHMKSVTICPIVFFFVGKVRENAAKITQFFPVFTVIYTPGGW